MKHLLFILFIITAFICFSCDSTEPIDKRKLYLSIEDVSVSEVWLDLFAEFIDVPTPIKLHVNSKYVREINLTLRDTLIIADSLEPNTTYTFQVFHGTLGSEIVTATTLDTTTQNFTFETVEFGDGFSSSYFNDVWIFDENNIWAVGYIYTDTVVNANIMRWNGEKWYFEKFSGTSSGIYGIWANSPDEIYFANGIVVKYKNGNYEYESFNHIPLPNGQAVEKLWGSSENNIWGVGPWGTIVHNDGNGWAKIDFDRQWYFYNITGNKETGIAYAVGRNTSDVCVIVELKVNHAKIIYTSGNTLPQLKSWTIKYHEKKLYLGGADILSTKIWEYDLYLNKATLSKDLIESRKNMGIRQVSVNKKNDIFYIGKSDGLGRMIHFNGIRYTEIDDGLINLNNSGSAYAIENVCISVGAFNSKAYITKIRRN